MIELNKIYFEDCLETMKRIPDGSIDLMITDPPYNTTQCEWDCAIDLPALWKEWLRIVKSNGAFVFTASQPFTTDLINSNRKLFKYNMIWIKNFASNYLNAKKQPLRKYEDVCIFYEKQCTYNPELINKNKESIRWNNITKKGFNGSTYGKVKESHLRYEFRDIALDKQYPANILYFNQEHRILHDHPTQKPVDLFRYLIKTYSNEGDTVFDGYSGSGTTVEACIEEKRNFVVSENNKEYFDLSEKRIKNYLLQQTINFI